MEARVWQAFPVEEQIHISDLYSLFEFHYACGYEFTGETHNFWECLYVVRGRIDVTADERVYGLQDGEIIFHKPLELHKFIVKSPEGADALIFSFTAEGPLTGLLRDKVFALTEAQKGILDAMLAYIRSQEAEGGEVQREHQYLLPYRRLTNYIQMVATYLCQLFLSLGSGGRISSVSSAQDAVIFRKAIWFLNSNLNGQPSVPEVARFCNVSATVLKRIFHKYAGVGVHKYLLKMKIKAAAGLLGDGQSVNAVAEALGFGSQSYFSRAFKRETGQSPSEFRR